jgi:hypothetical protein
MSLIRSGSSPSSSAIRPQSAETVSQWLRV